MLTRTLTALLTALLAACAAQGGVVHSPGVGDGAAAALDIPRADAPPGECRIGVPGVPPEQQPSPGDSEDLSDRVPPGAVLVR